MLPLPQWKDRLSGTPAFILGNGPSLTDEDTDPLRHYLTIGINRAFLVVDPTILIWQDVELWYTERKRLPPLQALKVCKTEADPQNRFAHFKVSGQAWRLPTSPGHLHGSGSTGPLAVQFAHALGCDPIVLLGMDCKPRGKATDFYGRNPHHKSHTMKRCADGLNWISSAVTDRTILSCSDNDVWPRTPLSEVIASLDPIHRQSRKFYVDRLNGG